ncbi:GNAT family N-acetyltransferase [Pseudoruegeria sp. SK021]|nr:N-acetyltransferase [Pseudoruegeria sp. SK021]OSP56789.1 GNAT family N-acetyltransferase [Pseudoruegeria sp. SK021]
MLEPAFRAGDTYTIDPGVSEDDALAYWTSSPKTVFLAETTRPLGTYFLTPNQGGNGAHVCNCGFVTAADAQGQGVASAMLNHALALAPTLGFRAMQFNFVVSTNAGAIRLWHRAGFDTVGRLPAAFRHPAAGYVDALVMYKTLQEV